MHIKKLTLLLTVALTSAMLLTGCKDANEGSQSLNETAYSTSVSGESSLSSETDASVSSESEAETPSTEGVNAVSTEKEPVKETKMTDIIWENNADISWIDPEKPMVAFTFDDGPVFPVDKFSSAVKIQNALIEGNAHATFFYWGASLSITTEEEVKRAFEAGFEIGNHTKEHLDLTTLSEEEIEAQVEYINNKLSRITGLDAFLVRPPYLAVSDKVKKTINVPLISCGIDSKDWTGVGSDEIINLIKGACEAGTLDGQIILMHETYAATAEAMEVLVPYLNDQGYQLVTVSELYKARGVELKSGNVYTGCR